MSVLKILVSGANGFVGRALCPVLRGQGHAVREAVRAGEGDNVVAVGDIHGKTDWSEALKGVDVVVHLAGRAHVLREHGPALDVFRRVNLEGTENLARQAAAHGARRLVFVSSIKVNGEETYGRAFTENDPPHPEDPYGISKWEAEQTLAEISAATSLEATILRPPLVHGPGVKGNLLRLLEAVHQNRTFPLGAVQNRRSLLGLDNLCAALDICVRHPKTGTYLIADDEAVSSPDLVRVLAKAMGRQARMLSVPLPFMELAAKVLKRRSEFRRLTGSLEVNAVRIQEELGWTPIKRLDQGLEEMALWYMRSQDPD
ncbi:MAG TPA: NAD-dependent epimerase/dehydratase family protein [Desulfonatronum sp.]|nr:NAD-dependent epimerase/dehydratase family protein [Desulfonatronum sp.]